jgi:hypothetical protein
MCLSGAGWVGPALLMLPVLFTALGLEVGLGPTLVEAPLYSVLQGFFSTTLPPLLLIFFVLVALGARAHI